MSKLPYDLKHLISKFGKKANQKFLLHSSNIENPNNYSIYKYISANLNPDISLHIYKQPLHSERLLLEEK